jgi:hypothetical protein
LGFPTGRLFTSSTRSHQWLVHIWRQVKQIDIRGVLHIEETFLPLLAGLEQFYLWKVGAFPGHDGGRATLGHGAILLFLSSFWRIALALGFLGALFAQLEVFGPSLGKGLYAGIALAESRKG